MRLFEISRKFVEVFPISEHSTILLQLFLCLCGSVFASAQVFVSAVPLLLVSPEAVPGARSLQVLDSFLTRGVLR